MNAADRRKTFKAGHGYSRKDWDAVASPELTAEEIASAKPAREVLPQAILEGIGAARRRGRPKIPDAKEAVTLRLSPETLARFKATGKDWRARMAEIIEKTKA